MDISKHVRECYPVFYKYYQEVIGELYYELLCLGFIIRHYSYYKFKKFRNSLTPVNTLFNYQPGIPPYNISFFQTRSEIAQLFDLVDAREPSIICEIGTDMGGTFFLWLHTLKETGTIISIDLPRTYRKAVNRYLKKFLSGSQKAAYIREDSHSPRCLAKLKSILKGRSLDFLFIDGDHSYSGVKKDFELFSPFVKKGGIIGLHDISVTTMPYESCGVNTFWNEIKQRFQHLEFTEKDGCGIGVILK